MGLRDEYNEIINAKNAEQKRQEDLSAKDGLLYEEILRLYTDEKHKFFYCADVLGKYYYSLPVSLPPESQKIIQELIEVCPPKFWEGPPTTITLNDIRVLTYEREYSVYKYFPLQYRLPDGSVHVGVGEVYPKKRVYEKPAFRFTEKGRKEAERQALENERQKAFKILEPIVRQEVERIKSDSRIVGARESISIRYRSARWNYDDNLDNELIIFQDGTVYDPYPSGAKTDSIFFRWLCQPSQELYCLCSERVKWWASNP